MDANQPMNRPKFQGNWVCGNCKGKITELPFQPQESRLNELLCRDCHRERKQSAPPRAA